MRQPLRATAALRAEQKIRKGTKMKAELSWKAIHASIQRDFFISK